mgnify:CR=1 FL=1
MDMSRKFITKRALRQSRVILDRLHQFKIFIRIEMYFEFYYETQVVNQVEVDGPGVFAVVSGSGFGVRIAILSSGPELKI